MFLERNYEAEILDPMHLLRAQQIYRFTRKLLEQLSDCVASEVMNAIQCEDISVPIGIEDTDTVFSISGVRPDGVLYGLIPKDEPFGSHIGSDTLYTENAAALKIGKGVRSLVQIWYVSDAASPDMDYLDRTDFFFASQP
jgi:hypothetical protein